jgi:FXSXX-COOH protein
MRSIDEAPAVSSALQDLRGVPLAELPGLSSAALDQALQRVLPGSSAAVPVPVAAFSSHI